MNPFASNQSKVEPLVAPCLGRVENIFIKRDDLIHPIVSGNKWRKLKQHIAFAETQGKKHLVTFGGAYSNHMVAVACAAAVLGFKSSCFIRGDELQYQSNHYLRLAKLYGMDLIPTERTAYREGKKQLYETHFAHKPEAFFIDEGGAGELGIPGVSEIIAELDFIPNHIIHASATATTAAGLLTGMEQNPEFKNTILHAVAVLKNTPEQQSKLEGLKLPVAFNVVTGFEFGGYAKSSKELMDFVSEFISQTGIIIDPVYTGKALFALKIKIETGEIKEHESVLFLHTGGTLGIFSDAFLSAVGN